MHVTQNYMAGNDPIAKEAMRHILSRRAARIAKGNFGDETVVFGKMGKGFHKAIVVYRKAAEMLAHAKGEDEKKRVKASPEYQFARDVGLIRVECKWGAHFLRDHGLRYAGGVNMGKLINLFQAETGFLMDAAPDRVARVVSDLPCKIRSAALHWIRGDDLAGLYSRRTYFRMVKALRDYGIDAKEPRHRCDAAEADLQLLLDALPTFDLRPLTAPEWYGLPEIRRAA